MTAATKDLKIEQGATYRLPFQWCAKNSDGSVGAPHDITGWSARMQIREKLTSEDVMVDATSDNGLLVLGGADGRVTIQLTEDATMALVKNGVYDLELVDPNQPPGLGTYRLLEGKVTVVKNVTR